MCDERERERRERETNNRHVKHSFPITVAAQTAQEKKHKFKYVLIM